VFSGRQDLSFGSSDIFLPTRNDENGFFSANWSLDVCVGLGPECLDLTAYMKNEYKFNNMIQMKKKKKHKAIARSFNIGWLIPSLPWPQYRRAWPAPTNGNLAGAILVESCQTPGRYVKESEEENQQEESQVLFKVRKSFQVCWWWTKPVLISFSNDHL